MRNAMVATVSVTLCLVASACGSASNGSPGSPPMTSTAEAADPGLGADFPIPGTPRPIVLVEDVPATTARLDERSALAVRSAAFVFESPVPELESVVDRLRKPSSAPPLPVTTVRPGTSTFASDRGPVQLSTWFLTTPAGTIRLPAEPVERFYRLGQIRRSESDAEVTGADGRTLTVHTTAAATCDDRPLDTTATETAQRVVLRARTASLQDASPGCSGGAAGRLITYVVRLSAPLGDRLLVDAGGAVVPVSAVAPG